MLSRINIISFLACVLAVLSCDRTPQAEPDVSISTRSVVVGNAVPVILDFNGFDGAVEFSQVLVSKYDINTDRADLLNDVQFVSSSGETFLFPTSVNIPESGYYQFNILGLEEGTYMVSVSVRIGGTSAFIKSSVFVVKSDEIDGGGSGGGEIPTSISDYTVPAPTEGSSAVRMLLGSRLEFIPVVTPPTVAGVLFSASSSAPSVMSVRTSSGALVFDAVSVGSAFVTIRPVGVTGPEKTVLFEVYEEKELIIDDFTLPQLDYEYGRLCIESGTSYSFTPTVRPVGVSGVTFKAVSSDPSVASVSFGNDGIVIVGNAPGYCNIEITPDNASGPTKSLPVLIFKDIVVRTEFYELEPTDEEIELKVFPCYIKFSATPKFDYPDPIINTVTMKAVVVATGYDSKSGIYKSDVNFGGKHDAYFNITEKVLIPASSLLPVSDYNLRITLSIVRTNPLDPALWRVTFNDVYLTQSARISEYIVDIQH